MNNKQKEEIINERVLRIARFVIATGASTRQAAKYFTKNEFPISNVTVHTYLSQKLPKLSQTMYEQVCKIIYSNTPKSIETVEVRKRIYSAISLLFKGYTIPEIAEELDSTVDIIYDDLTKRLSKIESDENIRTEVAATLSQHRLGNLCNQMGNGPYSRKVPVEAKTSIPKER